MARPVQAGSLAPVIDLAENPPDQPLHGSMGYLQQPLVLNIVRVPGSHGICFTLPNIDSKRLTQMPDFFLTTMKPQQKVVTAQDVQSSLYYMHLDRPEDDELLRSFDNLNHLSHDELDDGKPANPSATGRIRKQNESILVRRVSATIRARMEFHHCQVGSFLDHVL